jgi:hypothetical protein
MMENDGKEWKRMETGKSRQLRLLHASPSKVAVLDKT